MLAHNSTALEFLNFGAAANSAPLRHWCLMFIAQYINKTSIFYSPNNLKSQLSKHLRQNDASMVVFASTLSHSVNIVINCIAQRAPVQYE